MIALWVIGVVILVAIVALPIRRKPDKALNHLYRHERAREVMKKWRD